MADKVSLLTDATPTNLTPSEKMNATHKNNLPNNSQPKRPKVLIVDDSPTIIELIKYHLQSAGYDVVAQTKALGTMVTILRERPDLILLDIEIPLIDGLSLCTLLKQNSSMANIAETPVLFYSSISETELSQAVKKCGAQGYIHKHWAIDQIIQKINEFMKLCKNKE